ncbi:TIGR04282 family arsenosugar biosynthesis glycosyltransferase [Bacterioplanoides sp.]|uniref:TIGR04282 family arsenosugar biosynthesis glycosyltransferase n=1 Tax=Bacterioplanoides sp. TaxID=2066072 RepID=UPI003B0017A8
MKTRIIIFAKAPLPGLAKTRLIPALGEQGSAQLAKKLLQYSVQQAVSAGAGVSSVELCVAPGLDPDLWQDIEIPATVQWSEQGAGDLGERLQRASQRSLEQGEAVLLMGTDCPGLTAERLQQAANALQQNDTCMYPVSDGGYALLGLRYPAPSLFVDMPWSTEQVSRLTQQRIQQAGWSLACLETLHDIDVADDLEHLPAGWLSN